MVSASLALIPILAYGSHTHMSCTSEKKSTYSNTAHVFWGSYAKFIVFKLKLKLELEQFSFLMTTTFNSQYKKTWV